MQNRVILVDEYDQINDDIEPFFSLSAADLALRAQAIASDPKLPLHAESFSIRVKDGALSAFGPKKLTPRAEDAQDIMSEFVESLPDVTLTFSSRDGPVVAVSGEAKARHRDYARHGLRASFSLLSAGARKLTRITQYLTGSRPTQPSRTRPTFPGKDCARPTPLLVASPAASVSAKVLSVPASSRPTTSPRWTCAITPTSSTRMGSRPGAFLPLSFALALTNVSRAVREGPRPYLLYPVFSWFKTSMHSDLLSIPLEQYYTEVGADPLWEKKKDKVLWRGSSSGTFREKGTPWRSAHRDRLVLCAFLSLFDTIGDADDHSQ